jgi:hypothetical protein
LSNGSTAIEGFSLGGGSPGHNEDDCAGGRSADFLYR